MKHIILLIIALLGLKNDLFSQENDINALPNVILIVVDDMGWNDVSYHGSEIQTPTMDRLAAEGVELNRFYVHPACSPTRSALMTGKSGGSIRFCQPFRQKQCQGFTTF